MIKKNIVFIDSDCCVCNKFAEKILRKNSQKANLYISPLNGKTFQEVASSNFTIPSNSIVFLYRGKFYIKSKAIKLILNHLKVLPLLSLALAITPIKIADIVYTVFAINRRRFTKSNYCFLPTEAQKKYILP